jgi:superfamily I DNA/RNA helicase
MTSSNEVVLAAAGSGKTRRLIAEALSDQDSRVLITTYTRENLAEIEARLWSAPHGKTCTIAAMTWFEFLLRDAIKPYQSFKTEILRIRSINFATKKPMYAKKSSFESYYLDSSDNIYSDEVSDMACMLNDVSKGKVIRRLEQLYDTILIDEMQDLAGWDLDFVELLLKSNIRIVLVGDPRQAVYSTNRTSKNKNYRGMRITGWIDKLQRKNLCSKKDLLVSYRCSQTICDFADALFPDLPSTTSCHKSIVDSSGVYFVRREDVERYIEAFRPQCLRWNKSNVRTGSNARNFGDVKGKEFRRVLIYPTAKILNYLESGKPLEGIALAKFYVAITRASDSVGIVTDKSVSDSSLRVWSPNEITHLP